MWKVYYPNLKIWSGELKMYAGFFLHYREIDITETGVLYKFYVLLACISITDSDPALMT